MKTRIRDLREDRDLTQSEVSKLLNISQVAYSYYELNKRSIPFGLYCALLNFLIKSSFCYKVLRKFRLRSAIPRVYRVRRCRLG